MPTTKNLKSIKLVIDERSREFEARFAAGDAAGLVAGYFAPDSAHPMASPPGGQRPVEGHAALIAMFEAQSRDFRQIRLETLFVESGDAIAYEMGRAHLTLRTGPVVVGRYTVLWKNYNGEWRAQIDFFAADGWQD